MTAAALLADLQRQGVVLQAQGDGRLHYQAPEGALRDDDRRLLAEHKGELLALLRADVPVDRLELHEFDRRGDRVSVPAPVPPPAASVLLHSERFGELWLVRTTADLGVIRDEIDGRPVVYGDELEALGTKTAEELAAILETKRAMGPGTRLVGSGAHA